MSPYRRHIVFTHIGGAAPRAVQAMPRTVGMDFRATPGYVTDPAGYSFNGGTGWEAPPTGARDRSRTVDPRLAGCVFVLNKTGDTARLALSVAPGSYSLRLALGDATTVQRQNCELYDGTTKIATVATDHATGAGTFLDAMGLAHTAAGWVTSNTPRSLTINSGTLRLHLGNAASGLASTTIATLHLSPVGTPAPEPPPPSPPPQPPPPPPPSPPPPLTVFDPDPFKWNATTATLDPNSATLAASFVSYALPFGAYIAPNIAYAVVAPDGSTPTYAVATAGHPGAAFLDATLHVPNGAQASVFNDHHLTIIDRQRGRQHDLWRASFTNGKLTGWQAGCSINIGTIQQPDGLHSSSNGANLNAMGGVIRPDEVAAHDLSHPLVFACPQPGEVSAATPARYPANTKMGWPYPGHLPPSAWLRFPPGFAFPAMDAVSLYVCKRIQARGMFLADLNTHDLSFKGADLGGGMRSRAAWQNAGVNLNTTTNALRLSSSIPWHHLQVLRPPAP